MSYQSRAAIVLAPAVLLLFSLAAVGQTGPNKDRTVAGNSSSAHRRGQTRPGSQGAQANSISKLPFEESVVIYYKAPGKTSPSSNPPNPGPDAKSDEGKSEEPKKHRADSAMASAKNPAKSSRQPIRVNMGVDLQPVIIYYGAYRPAASAKSSGANTKPGAAEPLIRNAASESSLPKTGSILAKRSASASNAVSPGSVSVAEQSKPAEVAQEVRNEILPTKLNTNLEDALPAGRERSLSEPIATRVSSANSANSQAKSTVAEPAIETAVPTIERSAERSDAPSIGTGETRPVPKAEVPQTGAASSNVTPPSPSSTAPEISTPAASAVAEAANPGAESKPAAADSEIESGPLDAVGLNNAAVRLTLEHRYTEAQAFLERAIEAEPTAAKFHRNLSALFERMKKFDEALAAARTAAKLAPADPSVLDLLCGLEFVSGNTTAAIGCYEKFRSIEPLDVVSQTYYGLALFRSGKSGESITILEQAARSTPPAADALHALGVVYFKTKRYDEAAATLKNAVEAAPDANEIRYNLAIAELARRNRAAATSQYNIIKAADPELAGKLYRMLHGDKVLFVGDRQNPK